ncbi:hypothetical protein QNO07_09160 [Streptomyces sp. 549]|uniref:hypothetical protein n=1 Tax=Streptomyces sp. 549 TaxID=3049076 RepID=UPI0024C3CB38|nr:hypothetical protein [Streptomyces sp. 549]MDK1473586.1 hypothetical protein [Streptomyces sp. 549]
MSDDALTEPYDPLPDLIDRAERRRDGITQLKDVARLALHWHRSEVGWATDGVTKDPESGELMYRLATGCACGSGEFPCRWRRQITAIFGIEEEERW